MWLPSREIRTLMVRIISVIFQVRVSFILILYLQLLGWFFFFLGKFASFRRVVNKNSTEDPSARF